MDGFVKIDRKILEWEWWHDINTSRLFIYMLLRANWKEGKFKGIVIPKGSFVSSIPKLSIETDLTQREVRTAIEHLKTTGELTVKTTNKYSVFTIKNYCIYQDSDTQNDSQPTSELTGKRHSNDILTTGNRHSIDSLTTTIEEKKESKNNNITDTNVSVRQTETVRRVVDEWNTLREYGIKPISKLAYESKRYQSLCARINQYSVDDVLKAIDNIRHSDFLQGKTNGKRQWVITFDWFVLPNNFPKVLEGQYNNDSAKEVKSYESESSVRLW